MPLKGLAERSRQAYYGWVSQLVARFPGEDIPALPPQRVLDFLIHHNGEHLVILIPLTKIAQGAKSPSIESC
ncbi:MAG: hypothetical protein KA004_15670 [Verrucomicrobiales bacterium]|nr:hypothetical protein [Verrucomicrobiales bacterium]